MKKREDMIKNVHRRIDEYKAEQKKQNLIHRHKILEMAIQK